MSKENPQHTDRLGRLLKLEDCVAFPHSNSLMIGVIKKINPKMISIAPLTNKRSNRNYLKYSQDTVLLEGKDVTIYLLKITNS